VLTLPECLTFGYCGSDSLLITPFWEYQFSEYKDSLYSIQAIKEHNGIHLVNRNNQWVLTEVRDTLPFSTPYTIKQQPSGASAICSVEWQKRGYQNQGKFATYLDWAIAPRWQYQFDTFFQARLDAYAICQYIPKYNATANLDFMEKHGAEFLRAIRKIPLAEREILEEAAAMQFVQSKWSDNRFVRNRLATLSQMVENQDLMDRRRILEKEENTLYEKAGLAARLFLSYALLVPEKLPAQLTDILLSLGKDYHKTADLLYAEPKFLNEITLAIRAISPENSVHESNDFGPLGNPFFKLICTSSLTLDSVFGASGSPVLCHGKVIGIWPFRPFNPFERAIPNADALYIPMDIPSIEK